MLKKLPVFPFLLASYPVLALGAYNVFEINVDQIWRPLAISLLITGAILGLTYRLLRDWHRAAILTAICLLLFFSYGQIYAEVKGIAIADIFLFRHRVLGILWGLLLVAGVIWAWRWLKNPMRWTPWLNLLFALLLVFPIYTIASAAVSREVASVRNVKSVSAAAVATDTPDIYYIILDGYGRHDLLKEKFNYDNSDFVNGLRERGFYVPECSQSNYARTLKSLSSSLNMDYLENLPIDPKSGVGPFLKYSAVRAFLEQHGYKTAGFPTGYQWSEWTDADIYYEGRSSSTTVTEFEALLAQTTLLRILFDTMHSRLDAALHLEEIRRLRTFNALDALRTFPEQSGKLFVFAHIVIPHPPYYFGPNGEDVGYGPSQLSDAEERQAYADQARFISREILKVIDEILSKSDRPPVIIVQGDHGPPQYLVTPAERMQNLNAYYLPGIHAEKMLYPSITPVNTFRVILDQYFKQNLPLLKDYVYYSAKLALADAPKIESSCPERP